MYASHEINLSCNSVGTEIKLSKAGFKLKIILGSTVCSIYYLDVVGLPIQSESDSLLDTPEKRVIEWKFSELDINDDNLLRRKEVSARTVFFLPIIASHCSHGQS